MAPLPSQTTPDGPDAPRRGAPAGCDSPPPGVWRVLRPLFARRRALGGRGAAVGAALVAALGTLAVYGFTLHLQAARGVALWDPATPLDARIPAVPWTILLYASLYVDYALVALAAPPGERGAREALRLAQGMVLVALFSGLIFLLFPAQVAIRGEIEALRPEMPPWLGALYDALWTADRRWNAAPSLHVSHSLMPWLGTRAWIARRGGPGTRVAVELFGWSAWLALCASTLTTRQHYLADVLAGAAVGALAWYAYVRPTFVAADQKANDSAV